MSPAGAPPASRRLFRGGRGKLQGSREGLVRAASDGCACCMIACRAVGFCSGCAYYVQLITRTIPYYYELPLCAYSMIGGI
mmetsp:Transcript_31858/g.46646  ORF Transcript_31858/g.46646 Transcript_31858/m.46646 type:complete len:81 (+) Transcript_31858:1536-1778(+)